MNTNAFEDASKSAKDCRPRRAFTLVELLVVIAIIAMLAAMRYSALAKTRPNVQAFQCLNNLRQLAAAWKMYAGDNNDTVPNNARAYGTFAGWCNSATGTTAGLMTWTTSPGNTNTVLLLQGQLGPYLQTATVFKCPADNFLSAAQRAAGFTMRVRSVSMNAYVGASQTGALDGIYQQFYKTTDFRNPSVIFVILDEHPDSINDGFFVPPMPGSTSTWYDMPAYHHNGAGSFSFADGRAEIHKWLSPQTKVPVTLQGSAAPYRAGPDKRDILWLDTRVSYPP